MMTPLSLDRPVLPLDLAPGGEVVLRGSYASGGDGAVVDAFATSWPSGAPGGAGIDAGGLVDFTGGGLHVVSYDPATHVVHAVPTDGPAALCSALGAAAPCLPLRTIALSQSRLQTVADFKSSLHGRIEVEVVAPPAYAPAARAAQAVAPILVGAVVVLAAVSLSVLLAAARSRRQRSPAGQLARLAEDVRGRLERCTDPALAAALRPALAAATRALHDGRVDATSAEGVRVTDALRRVNARLEETASRARATEERDAADELVREVEGALEAADEANAAARR